MRNLPADLATESIADCLARCWGIDGAELTYAPVGHGSYHWIAADQRGPRWFVTVDPLPGSGEDRFATLTAAAGTSRQLADAGLEFVVAPVPDRSGTLVQRLQHTWALQVFPYVPGWSTDQGSWSDAEEQADVARLVGRLHSATPPSAVPRWEYAIPGRTALEAALDDLDRPWTAGPYAEAAHAFLIDERAKVHHLLSRYDDLVRELEADPDPWVVTHGEPDSDNVVRTGDDRKHLVDWSSVRLAPRERDLVEILNGVAAVLPDYQETAGPHPARSAGLELFGLHWSLLETSRKAQLFRHPRPGSTPTAADLRQLREQVDNPGGWFRPA